MVNEFSFFKKAEAALDLKLPEGGLAVLRLDGVNFSSLTKQFTKPFSKEFEKAMDEAAAAVLTRILPNALVTYVASDEISLVLSDRFVAIPYQRRIQKLTSVAASTAALAFSQSIGASMTGFSAFDGRFLTLDEPAAIREYLTWRRLDCRKNATTMAAQSLKSHKELEGVPTRERGAMLIGSAFETIPEGTFNGRFITKTKEGFKASPALRELTEVVSQAAVELHTKDKE